MKTNIVNIHRYLKNYALWYIGRYNVTSTILREKLLKKSIYNGCDNNDELLSCIDSIVTDFCRLGYINDSLFAQNKLRSLLQRGKSLKYSRDKLRFMGLSDDLIRESLNTVMGEDDIQFLEEQALSKLIAKKKILDGITEFNEIESRKIASLVRAGFSFNLVVKVLKNVLRKDYF